MNNTSEDIIAPLRLPINRIEPIDSREGFIIQKCVGKNVLHVGCTDWPVTSERIRNNDLLHSQITRVAKYCVGLDLSEEGTAKLCEAGMNNVDLGNAESMAVERYRLAHIDLIVAGEVIEHMNNPGLFLAGCSQILREGGELLITVPNAFSFGRFGRMIFGVEQVHKDHVAYYSPKTMTELLNRYGFDVRFLGVSHPYPANPLRKPWKLAGYALHKVLPQFGSSCIFLAKVGKSDSAGKKVLG